MTVPLLGRLYQTNRLLWVGEASVPEFSDLSVGTQEKKSPGNGKKFPVFPTFH
jgi:hypothetical protein